MRRRIEASSLLIASAATLACAQCDPTELGSIGGSIADVDVANGHVFTVQSLTGLYVYNELGIERIATLELPPDSIQLEIEGDLGFVLSRRSSTSPRARSAPRTSIRTAR